MFKLMALLLMPLSVNAAVMQSYVSIEEDGSVQFSVKKGELKPQILRLIAEHPHFPEKEKIIWAAPELTWPIDSAYRASSIDGLINDVASQLNLIVTYHPNGYAVVTQQKESK